MIGIFKKKLKSVLHGLGLLGPSQYLYFNLKAFTPRVFLEEIRSRKGLTPDGFPVPPAKLIYDIIGCRWAAIYLESGKIVMDDMIEILNRNSVSLSKSDLILDFGCGSGRLLRQLNQQCSSKLYGTDYNADLANWCSENLNFAEFNQNQIGPPLPFSDESLDYIYARSVFTHLPRDLQLKWMTEFRRILKRGGQLYFTMHGRLMSKGLDDEQRILLEGGDLVESYSSVAGENLCSTFALPNYVQNRLLTGFVLTEFVEGRAANHLKQDIYLVEKSSENYPDRLQPL